MKRVAIVFVVLLLAGCSSPSEKIAGQVVSCESITSFLNKTSIVLDCLDGSEGASINGIKGPAIINVWGSWCGPCKEEIPILRSFYEKAQGKLALVGVDVEEASIEDGRKFVENYGITWPNLFDSDGKSRVYFGMGVPVTWFIAADGSVAYKHIGVLKSEIELISMTSRYLGVKL
ncbi:MAG: TlpA disulfide reductase family protein [Actinobacteria bacterium]|nr:TlpA disulfide reductase family protein [Actinomycetota bacterium]